MSIIVGILMVLLCYDRSIEYWNRSLNNGWSHFSILLDLIIEIKFGIY